MISTKLDSENRFHQKHIEAALDRRVGYNSVYVVRDSCTKVGFSGSINLMLSLKFALERPLLPWKRKFWYLNTNLAIIAPVLDLSIGDESQILLLNWVFEVGQFNRVVQTWARWTPLATIRKIVAYFVTKFWRQ